ncbi:MAG TPA: ABC transporter permease subunit [Planctomycetota bacterium]|nr:ABC transporter permease subunit [Planctomycetota bacterium]
MRSYVLKRLLLMIPTLFGVSVVVWLVLTAAPEPPVTQQIPTSAESGMTQAGGVPDAVKVFRAQYGLDKPKMWNNYYALTTEQVRQALEDASDLDRSRALGTRTRAQERLIEWGEYAVPALVAIESDTKGALRDRANGWLVRAAKRVAVGQSGGRVSPERARRNAEIARENGVLDLYLWSPSASEAQKAAAAEAIETWYDGARADYDGRADASAVRAALERDARADLERLGAGAVPALVALATGDDPLADRAVEWVARLGRLPVEGDEAQRERAELRNATLGALVWKASEPETTKRGGADALRTWWEGARARWDYSGMRWLRVLLLETQFATYWGNLLRFDLGESRVHRVPVFTLVLERLKYSLTLSVTSILLAYLISVPLGILSARIHGSHAERGTSLFLFALYSLPSFYVATLAIRYLARDQPGSLEWIPEGRFEDLSAWRLPSWEWIRNIAWHIAAPIACLTYGSFAALSRYAKTGVLHVIRSDYVRTARAKGLGEFAVTVKHAARNGIIPVITLLGGILPAVVGGSFIIEVIFSIPGFGMLTIESIHAQDYTVIVGVELVVAVLTMVGILLSDLLYAVVDPRISYS